MAAAGGGVVFSISANAEQVVAASQQGQAALRELSEAYQQQAQIINTVSEAYRMMGAAQADAYAGLLQGVAGTEEYGAMLDAVRAQMLLFQAQQVEATGALGGFHEGVVALQGMDGPLGGLGNMLSGLEPLFGAIAGGATDFGDIAGELATGALGALSGGFAMVTDAVGGFLSQMSAMTVGMMAFQAFGWATQQVQGLAQEMIQLSMTMQSQDVGWAYLFGGQGLGPGGTTGPNYDTASQLMGWTAVQSYNAPYTRQDMNQAISTLQTTGLNEAGIEQFLPVMEDLGVRNPQLGLPGIAQSIMGAMFGYTRMLRYDLKITPQQLEQYGLVMNGTSIDPSTLLPALTNYALDQGYYNPTYDAQGNITGDKGAAYYLAHNTLQGASTSWQDRLQNFLLQLGGTYWGDQTAADATPGGVMVRDPEYGMTGHTAQYIHKDLANAGDVRQGSIFDDLIVGLNTITTWWDAHQTELNKLADLFGNGIGLAAQTAGNAVQAFAEGLKQSGLGDDILSLVQNGIGWLADPQHQEEIKNIAETLGTDLGDAAKNLGDDFSLLYTDIQKVVGILSPEQWQGLGVLIAGTFQVIGDAISTLLLQFAAFADFMKLLMDLASGASDQQIMSDLSAIGQDAVNYHNYQMQQMQQGQQAAAGQTNNAPPASQQGPGGTGAGVKPVGGGDGGGGGGAGGGARVFAAPVGSISYGGDSYTINITGASGAQVQSIVEEAAGKRARESVSQSKRPGGPRFARLGLIY